MNEVQGGVGAYLLVMLIAGGGGFYLGTQSEGAKPTDVDIRCNSEEAKEGRKALDAFRAKEAGDKQRLAALEKKKAEDERRQAAELNRKKEAEERQRLAALKKEKQEVARRKAAELKSKKEAKEKQRLAALEKQKKEKATRIEATKLKRKKEAEKKRRLAKLEKKKKEAEEKDNKSYFSVATMLRHCCGLYYSKPQAGNWRKMVASCAAGKSSLNELFAFAVKIEIAYCYNLL